MEKDNKKEYDNVLFPLASKVFANTVANNLVSVEPSGLGSEEELNKIKNRIDTDNREKSIDSILEGKDYKPKKYEEYEEYKEYIENNHIPKVDLLYLDFKYNDNKNDEEGE